jgi:hypothetical protein
VSTNTSADSTADTAAESSLDLTKSFEEGAKIKRALGKNGATDLRSAVENAAENTSKLTNDGVQIDAESLEGSGDLTAQAD